MCRIHISWTGQIPYHTCDNILLLTSHISPNDHSLWKKIIYSGVRQWYFHKNYSARGVIPAVVSLNLIPALFTEKMLQLNSKKVKWAVVPCAVAPFPETLSHASQQWDKVRQACWHKNILWNHNRQRQKPVISIFSCGSLPKYENYLKVIYFTPSARKKVATA